MVDKDGKNRFPQDENWLTDGYGDYVRHYLRAMATCPELAPASADHILSSTSVIQQADYRGQVNKFLVPYVKADDPGSVRLFYRTFDSTGTETIRMTRKPSQVLLNGLPMKEVDKEEPQGYRWIPLPKGGVLYIRRLHGKEITLLD
jgi:hypothetical protein